MIDFAALQHRLAQRSRLALQLDGFRESAVLVPIVLEPTQAPRLLLTVRTAELRAHGGQIAFPGGRRDEGDADAAATALREAEEELGIPAPRVRVLGALDDVPTPSRYIITPIVGLIEGPLTLTPSPGEVAAAFLPGLGHLADPASYSDGGERTFLGLRYVMHQYRFGEHNIWGATARIVHQLLALLAP